MEHMDQTNNAFEADEAWTIEELDERDAPLLKTLYEKAQLAAITYLIGS